MKNMDNIDYASIREWIKAYAKKAGRVAARPVVLLYLVLRNPATPRKDKWIVYAALAYVMLPVDFIPARRFALLGWTDESAAIAVAYKRVKGNVTPAVEMQADEILNKWFPEDAYAVEVS